jgi:hypothetical protein
MRSARALRFAVCGILVLICGAIAHELIDLAGDVLLAHDTYDGLTHDSRILFGAGGVLALLCLALGSVLRVLDCSGGFDLACAARRTLRRKRELSTVLVAATLTIVPLMEWVDASLAGASIDGIGDLYGGSLLLGLAGCVAAALLVVRVVLRAAHWLSCRERQIIRLIVRLFRGLKLVAAFVALRSRRVRIKFASAPIARNRALRAPPAVLAS